MQTETFTLGPLTMYVSEDHRFGTDAFLLAYYANVKPDSVVCDLCTGCRNNPADILQERKAAPYLRRGYTGGSDRAAEDVR